MQNWMLLAGVAVLTFWAGAEAVQAQATKQRSAVSIQCSKQADAKGLHGKERKAFREKCKKSSKPSNAKSS